MNIDKLRIFESLLFLGVLPVVRRGVLLVPPKLYARHLIIEFPELLVLLDVGRGLVGQGDYKFVDLKGPC